MQWAVISLGMILIRFLANQLAILYNTTARKPLSA